MSLALYRSLIGQLEDPEIIRLNYSGESIHYPYLEEAIRLARATGATTELVSAFSSASPSVVRTLVDAGLHRLSISLHTTDEAQYGAIYGFSSLASLHERLAELRRYKQERGAGHPEIDFAFVAMRENLAELPRVAALARNAGAKQLSVHPVIRRHPELIRFPKELDEDDMLRPAFSERIHAAVQELARQTPEIAVTVARPQSCHPEPLSGIATCEQNPWDTVHVLEDGKVVVCEVQDHTVMGNLNDEPLAHIWHGLRYKEFRDAYLNGNNAACTRCAWRQCATLATGGSIPFRGWHPRYSEPVRWSQRESGLIVSRLPGATALRITGVLPPGPAQSGNELLVHTQGAEPARYANASADVLRLEARVPLRTAADGLQTITFQVKHTYCPSERGSGPDLRRLGFGLIEIEHEFDRNRRRAVERLFALLRRADRFRPSPGPRTPWQGAGISIVIPERANPELLERCLRSAAAAAAAADEPVQTIVSVNGTLPAAYGALRRRFPRTDWVFHPRPLPFNAAILRGLRRVAYPWVYLLNNDMVLDQGALAEVMRWRGPDTFAAGSRIEMEDGSGMETNWTDLRRLEHDAVELVERDPEGLCAPRGCLYAGGGSALFNTELLRRLARRTSAYDPFYWEDVEWGASAWRLGYRSIYCPASVAVHSRRRTVGLFYTQPEIDRIFERNRLLFHLRNIARLEPVRSRLLSLDETTWADLFSMRTLASCLLARVRNALAPFGEEALNERWRLQPQPPPGKATSPACPRTPCPSPSTSSSPPSTPA